MQIKAKGKGFPFQIAFCLFRFKSGFSKIAISQFPSHLVTGEVFGNQDGDSITRCCWGGTRRKRRALGTSSAQMSALGQLRAQQAQATLSTTRTAKQPLGSTEQEPEWWRQDSAKQVSLGPPLTVFMVLLQTPCHRQTPLPQGLLGWGEASAKHHQLEQQSSQQNDHHKHNLVPTANTLAKNVTTP